MKNGNRQIKTTKWEISPWWNNGERAEIGENAPLVIPGHSPIRYGATWEREREEFRYTPRFLANTVTFDRRNRPVIRVGVHDVVGKHATVYYYCDWVKEVYVQTLNADGQWIALPLHNVMRDAIMDWNDDTICSGTYQPEERVVFDAAGDAYTIVKTRMHEDFLLHSRDDMESWEVYPMPQPAEGENQPRLMCGRFTPIYRIEKTASQRPPVIFALHNREDGPDPDNRALSIIAPKKKTDGTLETLSLIKLVPKSSSNGDQTKPQGASDGPSHAGVSDQTATIDQKTHIVYINLTEDSSQTCSYVITYNHGDGSKTEPIFLDATESVKGRPDHHNGPAIVADRQGYLHVVLGAHQKPFRYLRSMRPNDATEWKDHQDVNNPSGKETYASLVIGPDDTLHLVSRMVEVVEKDKNLYSLHYMRKKNDETSWEDFGKLLVPKRTAYSSWEQKLTVDRIGRLFLAYFYYAHDLVPKGQEASEDSISYCKKWGKEPVCQGEKYEEDVDKGKMPQAHDPVILMSSDSGYSWKFATTPDFPTVWDWVSINSPAWSDKKQWDDIANYSTIQTAVVKNKLYLLGRGDAGVHIWEFADENNTWTKVATNTDLSDAAGWDDVSNYSTIQTAVVNDVLYLIARGNKGMLTWELQGNHWSLLEEAKNDPELSDAQGWKDVANYSTIQTVVMRGELYMLARGDKGLWTWKLDLDAKHWVKLAENEPKLADANGWNDRANYSTIHTAVVRGKLYLLARGGKGMQIWRFDPNSDSWIRFIKDSPVLADASGWDDPANYSTIQTVVLNHKLYLLARADAGMQIWVFDPDISPQRWTLLVRHGPSLSDAEGWDDVTNYTTIQAVVMKGELYLLARANAGIFTWKFHPESNSWSRLAANNPGWSDASGWDDASNYTTIQTAVTNNELYLLARANEGMHTWKFNGTP